MNGRRAYLPLIIVISLAISSCLIVATYYINFWPSDSVRYTYYAAQLPHVSYVSQILELYPPRTMLLCGKEALLLGIWILQTILGDHDSLFPNILFLILAVNASAVFLYLIGKKLWNEHLGFLAFTLFCTSAWPYLYILQGAHPPLALMFFLLSALSLVCAGGRPVFYVLAGVSLGFMFFSSPTAILYLPYGLGLLIFLEVRSRERNVTHLVTATAFLAAGLLAATLAFLWPHPITSVLEHLNYYKTIRTDNFFVVDQAYHKGQFSVPQGFRGAGWAWVLKYALLIMPIMFPVFVVSLVYLLRFGLKRPRMMLLALCVCLPPIIAEYSQAPQFGRNYFPWLAGIIATICCAADDFFRASWNTLPAGTRQRTKILAGLLLASHVIINAQMVFGDALPSRLATRNIYQWLIKHRANVVFIHRQHPRNINIGLNLVNPKYKGTFYVGMIDSIKDVAGGYILVSPVTGKTIYANCRGESDEFRADPYLNDLMASKDFSKYVVASFKTLSSSKIWAQEEEVCTYRDLILHQISDADRRLGYAWVLDATKLHKEWFPKQYPGLPPPQQGITVYKCRPYFNDKAKSRF